MAARVLRTAMVAAVATLCAAAVVALPAVLSTGGSSASAADSCSSATPSVSPSASDTASPNPLQTIIGQLPGGSPSPSDTATASTSPSSCPTPSPSASSCSSASASPSASSGGGGLPIPLPGGSSPSATPTATTSPSNGCAPPCNTVSLRINTTTINATGLASVTVTGAQPGAQVELQGYSQNHQGTQSFDNDPTNPDRVGTADSNGTITFDDLRPASNTRLRARQTSSCPYSASGVINVRTQLTLAASRTGVRRYKISGKSTPARPGGLIVGVYRNGVLIKGGQVRADATTGNYAITLTFPASDQNDRINVTVRTGQDAQNAPGVSNVRSLLIY